jgi:GT2 family glycosyltransferase
MVEHLKTLKELNAEPRQVLSDISIVIPTLGRPLLENCLHSIAIGNCWPARIIVVHQGSNPQVASWIDRLELSGIRCLYISSSLRGRASAINRGLEQLDSPLVAITDDDCMVDEGWLKNMANRLFDNPDSIVTGRVDPAGDMEVVAVVTRQRSEIYRRPGLKFDAMSGGNMGTSIDVLQHVGLFDEDPRLRCAEDGEYAYRALRSGIPIIYSPEVSLRHYGWRDTNQRLDQYRTYARSHGAFYGKYLRKGDWFIALRVLIHHGRAFKRMIKGSLSGNQEQTLLGRSYVTGLLPGIIAGFGKENLQ